MSTLGPALGPRRRALDPRVASRLRTWVLGSVTLPAETRVDFTEWVAMDSRAPAQHMVHVVLVSAGSRRRVTIDKASDRITLGDVRSALSVGEVSECPTSQA